MILFSPLYSLIRRGLQQDQEDKPYSVHIEPAESKADASILDTLMDRDTRHRKMMEHANQHRELDRAKPKALEYPHVYGAPTGGNILNTFGKRYALPIGTERHLEDVG